MIDILLATYNGEKYLAEQLDSIVGQTFTDWRLVIHDDGSVDDTLKIIKHYASIDSRVLFIQDNLRFGSAKKNFSHLMQFIIAPYIMFCDQDDVWLPNKIEKSFGFIRSLEQQLPHTPILVYTDLEVVDESLNVIAASMYEYQKFNIVHHDAISSRLVDNVVTGCTVMFNGELYALSRNIPDCAIMHDWWLVLVCMINGGAVKFLPEATILYRQHSSNVVGTDGVKLSRYAKKFWSLFKIVERIHKQATCVGVKISFYYMLYVKIVVSLKRVFRWG